MDHTYPLSPSFTRAGLIFVDKKEFFCLKISEEQIQKQKHLKQVGHDGPVLLHG